MDTDKNTYRTQDLYFAAYLFAKGFSLNSLDYDQSGRFFWFIFPKKTECDRLEQEYLKNDLQIAAKDYAEAIKYLKRKVTE